MARRGGGEGGGMAGPLIGVAVSLLVFVILIIFAPTIAGSIENASDVSGKEVCTIYLPGGAGYNCTCNSQSGGRNCGENITVFSDWNTSENADLPTGVDTWTTVIDIIAVAFLVIAISIAIFYLKGM